MTKSRMDRRRSISVPLRALAPVQLLAQHGEVAVAGRMQEADGVFGALQAHAVAGLRRSKRTWPSKCTRASSAWMMRNLDVGAGH